MTTLDDVERTLRRRRWRSSATPRARSGIAGIMGGQISEVSDDDHARADGGGHLGRPEHPADLEGARAAHRGLGALREAAPPRAGDRGAAAGRAADGRAVRRALRARHDRRLPEPGASRAWSALRARAHGAAARRAHRRASAWRRSSSGSASSTRRGRRLARDGAALARRRRAARGRPDRGGRAHPRPRQAADHAARAREGAVGPAHARASDCGAGWRTRCATAAWTRRSPTASPRPRRSRGCASATSPLLRLANPLSEDQSVMRPLLLPGLLDAARHNAAHGRAGVALFESAHVYLPAGPLEPRAGGHPARRAARRRAPPPRRAADRGGAGRLAQPGAARRLLRAPRRCSRRCSACAGVEWQRGAGGPAVPAPGPRRRGPWPATGASSAGSASCTRWSLREWDLEGPAAAFELDLDALAELSAGRLEAYGDVTSFPAVLQDIAVVVPDDVPRAPRSRSRVRAGGGELLGGARACSTSTGASRWGRATSRWRCGSSSARPTAR